MTFGAVLHKEFLWDFSFSVLGHGIITKILEPRSQWPASLTAWNALMFCESCECCSENVVYLREKISMYL